MPRRVTRAIRAHQPKPLPQREGIDPVALLLPRAGETADEAAAAQPPRPTETFGARTVQDYLVNRFYPHDRAAIAARFAAREVKTDDGADVRPDDPLDGQLIWYYRQLGHERAVPVDMPVLFEDDWVIAVDKPHFLPTTPNGSFVVNTALAKLRVRENNPLLIPVHRLDRHTAGVVVFAKTVAARRPFQLLFQNRHIDKTYEAVAPLIPGLPPGRTLEVASRLDKRHGTLQVTQLSPAEAEAAGVQVNARTGVRLVKRLVMPAEAFPVTGPANPALPMPAASSEWGHYELSPHTGKTHQLRAHMHLLGAPLAGDVLYPEVLPHTDDEPALPLQLLARSLAFEHPVTGETIRIDSRRELALVKAAERR